MSRLWHKASGLGALGALICFFLPWMTVSCGDKVTTPTGWQVAVGGTVETNMGPEEANGHLFVFLAFVAGLFIILIVLLGWRRGPDRLRDAIFLFVLSGCAVLALTGFFLKNQTDLTGDVDVIVEYKPAFFGSALGYLLALAASVVGLVRRRPPARLPAGSNSDPSTERVPKVRGAP